MIANARSWGQEMVHIFNHCFHGRKILFGGNAKEYSLPSCQSLDEQLLHIDVTNLAFTVYEENIRDGSFVDDTNPLRL